MDIRVASSFNLLVPLEGVAKQRTYLPKLTDAVAITLSVSARHLAKDALELGHTSTQSIHGLDARLTPQCLSHGRSADGGWLLDRGGWVGKVHPDLRKNLGVFRLQEGSQLFPDLTA